jgi:hypothetical protein
VIDYKWVNPTTQKDYEKLLSHDAIAFLAWRARAVHRKADSLERAFRSWWLAHGRMDFRTIEDSMRFRKELFAYAESIFEDTRGADDNG